MSKKRRKMRIYRVVFVYHVPFVSNDIEVRASSPERAVELAFKRWDDDGCEGEYAAAGSGAEGETHVEKLVVVDPYLKRLKSMCPEDEEVPVPIPLEWRELPGGLVHSNLLFKKVKEALSKFGPDVSALEDLRKYVKELEGA